MGYRTISVRRAWLAYLLAGLAIVCVFFALPGQSAQNIIYDAIGLSAVVAILVGVRRNRPEAAHPWYLLALGDGLAVAGDLLWTYDEVVRGVAPPFPALADLLYLGGYVVFFVGVLLLARDQARGGDRAATLDTAIVAVAVGGIVWTFLIGPAMADDGRTLLERLVAGAYPAIDLLILAAALRLWFGLTRRTTSLHLLLLALVLSFATDILYAIVVARGEYATGHPLDAGWLLAYLLHGTLALHPSMRASTALAAGRGADLPRGRLPLLAIAVLTGPVLLALETARGATVDVPAIVGVSAALALLTLARLHLRDARARALIRRSADGLAIVDTLGRTLYQSPAAERILGIGAADLRGADVFARIHPDDRARAGELFAVLLASRKELRASTMRVRHADGAWRTIEIHATNLLDEPAVGGLVVNYRDITERARAESLLVGQAALLERIAQDAPLEETLGALAHLAEESGDGALVSIRLLDEDGATLRAVAAPSLPPDFAAATGCIPVGEGVGACGTAAARGEPVISDDIADDPLWADYRDFTLAQGLRACWSIPIRAGGGGDDGRLLGTFAVYYTTPRRPGAGEWEAIVRSVGLAALAIERTRAAEALRQGAESFASLFDATSEAQMIHDGRAILAVNAAWADRLGYRPDELIGREAFFSLTPASRADATRRSGAGDERPYEAAVVARDGRTIPVEVAGRAIRFRGRPARLVTQRDISERHAARAALEASEARFRALVQHATDVVTVVDAAGTITYQSLAATHVLGTDPAALIGRSVFALVHRENRARVRQLFAALLAAPSVVLTETLRVRHRDGSWRVVEVTGTNLLAEPAVAGIVANLRDVTARAAAEEALRRSEASLASAQRIGHIGSWEYDFARDELRWSDEVFRIAGYPPQAFVPTTAQLIDILHPDDREMVTRARRDSTERGVPYAHDCRLVRPDGEVRVIHQQAEVIRDAAGRPLRRLGVVHDVTEQRALEARLAHQATHDALTGLPNRALLLDRLDQALDRARRGGPADAVLFLDLDRFKEVNDSRGHDAGDRFLVAVAARLRHHLRDADTLARLGGDEFAILLSGIADASQAARTAERLLAALGRPLVCDGHEYTVTASVGVVVATVAYDRPEDVLRDADVAMYRAKGSGRAGYALFDPAMQAALADRLELERDLRVALERGEFALHYQPIVDLRDGRIAKVEALARWRHPVRGPIPPTEFIALAEEAGLIGDLGRWVLDEACRQVAAWLRVGCAVPVAVNLTAREFGRPTLPGEVASALASAGLDPAWLSLEITESLAMHDADATAATLSALRELGVGAAIDDFGTGYSSLAYLKRLPVDALKIDKAFVDGLATDAEDAAIVAAIVGLGRILGLRIVAEGVETAAQAAHLRALDCDFAQGYHFSPPLPGTELTPLLRAGTASIGLAAGALTGARWHPEGRGDRGGAGTVASPRRDARSRCR